MTIQASVRDKNSSGNPNSPMSGPILAITASLQAILQIKGAAQNMPLLIKNCLEAGHPGKVKEIFSTIGYGYIWNGESWIRVCTASASYEVTVAAGQIAVVDISEGVEYTTP